MTTPVSPEDRRLAAYPAHDHTWIAEPSGTARIEFRLGSDGDAPFSLIFGGSFALRLLREGRVVTLPGNLPIGRSVDVRPDVHAGWSLRVGQAVRRRPGTDTGLADVTLGSDGTGGSVAVGWSAELEIPDYWRYYSQTAMPGFAFTPQLRPVGAPCVWLEPITDVGWATRDAAASVITPLACTRGLTGIVGTRSVVLLSNGENAPAGGTLHFEGPVFPGSVEVSLDRSDDGRTWHADRGIPLTVPTGPGPWNLSFFDQVSGPTIYGHDTYIRLPTGNPVQSGVVEGWFGESMSLQIQPANAPSQFLVPTVETATSNWVRLRLAGHVPDALRWEPRSPRGETVPRFWSPIDTQPDVSTLPDGLIRYRWSKQLGATHGEPGRPFLARLTVWPDASEWGRVEPQALTLPTIGEAASTGPAPIVLTITVDLESATDRRVGRPLGGRVQIVASAVGSAANTAEVNRAARDYPVEKLLYGRPWVLVEGVGRTGTPELSLRPGPGARTTPPPVLADGPDAYVDPAAAAAPGFAPLLLLAAVFAASRFI